jgi:formate-nitrite transporter family protein
MDQGESLLLLDPVQDWDHARGPESALLTLVEYGDYQCPDCGKLFGVLQRVQNEFAIRLVYRHYPLSGIHKRAQAAAEAAEAASVQGRFWEMHDLLFENQHALEPKDLVRYATQLGLDTGRFQKELKEGTHSALVRANFMAGVRNGVNGTPGLFLNGVRQQGEFSEQTVRRLLAESSKD